MDLYIFYPENYKEKIEAIEKKYRMSPEEKKKLEKLLNSDINMDPAIIKATQEIYNKYLQQKKENSY